VTDTPDILPAKAPYNVRYFCNLHLGDKPVGALQKNALRHLLILHRSTPSLFPWMPVLGSVAFDSIMSHFFFQVFLFCQQ
jgi:hypothetical protein